MNVRAEVSDDVSGNIVHDLFFQVKSGPQLVFRDLPNVLSRETSGSAGIEVDAEQVRWAKSSSKRCLIHPEFTDVAQLEFVHSSPNAPPQQGELFGGLWDPIVYMRPRFQNALLEGGFQGIRFLETEIDFEIACPFDSSEIKALCFDGRSIQRNYRVSPLIENHCVHCGYEPIACTFCPTIFRTCPSCGRRVLYIEENGGRDLDWQEKIGENGDIRFVYALDGGSGPVLDLRLWDGSDFLGGEDSIVTGRVVDTLLSLAPDAIGFQPRPCYVADGDPADYEHLKSKRFQELLNSY